MNWLTKLFGNKQNIKSENIIQNQKINYNQINLDWNADPVSPEIELKISGQDLVIIFSLNYYAFEKFSEGDKVIITFKNCSKYSTSNCNDEGYFQGEYRIKPNELEWGEFYEIFDGKYSELPKPNFKLSKDFETKRHFLFFFRDETFECLAEDFNLEFMLADIN